MFIDSTANPLTRSATSATGSNPGNSLTDNVNKSNGVAQIVTTAASTALVQDTNTQSRSDGPLSKSKSYTVLLQSETNPFGGLRTRRGPDILYTSVDFGELHRVFSLIDTINENMNNTFEYNRLSKRFEPLRISREFQYSDVKNPEFRSTRDTSDVKPASARHFISLYCNAAAERTILTVAEDTVIVWQHFSEEQCIQYQTPTKQHTPRPNISDIFTKVPLNEYSFSQHEFLQKIRRVFIAGNTLILAVPS